MDTFCRLGRVERGLTSGISILKGSDVGISGSDSSPPDKPDRLETSVESEVMVGGKLTDS